MISATYLRSTLLVNRNKHVADDLFAFSSFFYCPPCRCSSVPALRRFWRNAKNAFAELAKSRLLWVREALLTKFTTSYGTRVCVAANTPVHCCAALRPIYLQLKQHRARVRTWSYHLPSIKQTCAIRPTPTSAMFCLPSYKTTKNSYY